jgi:chitin disaccharide deacetylase
MRVILHADDLGISAAVNDAIFGLMDEGKLTSASILANGPAFADAVRRLHFFRQCSFGVHLNLTQFEPLSLSFGLAPFFSNEGAFERQPLLSITAEVRSAVLREWTTQVRRARQAGVSITHVDSHHHIHTRVALLPCLKQLCREQELTRVRLRHTFSARQTLSRWRLDNHLYNWALRRKFTCTDQFGPLMPFLSLRRQFPTYATVELMVHPGHDGYIPELNALNECTSRAFLRKHQRITYRDLH